MRAIPKPNGPAAQMVVVTWKNGKRSVDGPYTHGTAWEIIKTMRDSGLHAELWRKPKEPKEPTS